MTNGLDMDVIATEDDDLDIDALNDSQLYEQLNENNIVAGPIVDSTREIYKKKLKKVLYGVDEESFASGGVDGESLVSGGVHEESFVSGGEAELVNDQGYEKGTEADGEEKEETVENVVEKDEEEVVDGVTENKSDTDDDQPGGVSRSVDAPSVLRKRVHGNDAEATEENHADPQPDEKPKTLPRVLLVVFLMIVVGAAMAIYCLDVDMSDIEDPFREVPVNEEISVEAANNAADDEKVFTF